MTNEIKEIIDYFRKYATIRENTMISEIEDYITNLQEENERLKELINPKTQIFIDTQDMEERYGEELYKEYLEKQVKDYKSRIDKAIEKIDEPIYYVTDNMEPPKIFIRRLIEVKDILQGEDNE